MELSWVGWTHFVVLVVVLPGLALVQPSDEIPLPPRRSIYVSASSVLWVLAAVTVGVLAWEGVAPHHLRMYGAGLGRVIAWSVAAMLGALGVAAAWSALGRRLGLRESRWVEHLMPRSRAERATFVGVALTAGVTEELMYRGYALWVLSGALGDRPWAAALLLSVPFGVLHAYQRAIGVVRATLLGFLLSVPVLLGGGVVAAMAAHFGVNVVLGHYGSRQSTGRRLICSLSTVNCRLSTAYISQPRASAASPRKVPNPTTSLTVVRKMLDA